MATNYKNILLKDSSGQVLLPITLSYYVEYKDGTSVKSYLDDLSSSLDAIEGKIALNGEVQQNIIKSVNEILTSYVAKPDYAYAVVFDNSSESLSDDLKNITKVEGSSYVSTQQAIEALDARITSTYSYVTSSINSLTSYANGLGDNLTQLDTRVQGLVDRVDTVETKTNYAYTKVNTLFGSDGNLDIAAGSIKYSGSAGAGTDSKTNVQDAIDLIGTKLETIKTSVEGVISQAGVSYVTGSGGILVNDKSNEKQQGAVTVKVNLDNNKLSLNDGGAITVNDSALSITASQIDGLIPANKIEGGLSADNINITYSYVDSDGNHDDGKKSVQEFYNETDTKIKELEAASKAETLDGKYKVTVTPSDSEDYAKVYTLTQNSETIGTINIPKDQFLKKVEYVDAAHAPEGAQEGDYPALVFTWNLSDADETTGAPTSIVPIASFVDAITSEIVKDVTALKGDVETLKTSVEAIKTSYITGATVNGQTVDVVDHVLQLSYNILYESGKLSEGISEGFLQNNGIKLS